MKIYGIICEFNPFHDGHKYLIEKTREITGADAIVCVMSGSVVQRGDVAVYDKWTRAECAVKNGADLVVELPAVCVLQSADNFADGGVSILNGLGATGIAFGCECANVDTLKKIADISFNEPEEYKIALKNSLDEGNGYPVACEEALKACINNLDESVFAPNSTLASAYIKASLKQGADLDFCAIKRIGDYHSEDLNVSYPSATAIRNRLLKENENVYDIKKLTSLILGFFRLEDEDMLNNICQMEPGLANRMIKAAGEAVSLDDFISKCVTKRYTAHRIRRAMLCSLLGIREYKRPDYARVLSFNDKGAQILKQAKKKEKIEIITKIQKNNINEMLKKDILATDIAALCKNQKSGLDFTTSPVKV